MGILKIPGIKSTLILFAVLTIVLLAGSITGLLYANTVVNDSLLAADVANKVVEQSTQLVSFTNDVLRNDNDRSRQQWQITHNLLKKQSQTKLKVESQVFLDAMQTPLNSIQEIFNLLLKLENSGEPDTKKGKNKIKDLLIRRLLLKVQIVTELANELFHLSQQQISKGSHLQTIIVAWALGSVFMLQFSILIFFSIRVIRPLLRLQAATQTVKTGDFNTKVIVDRMDEMGRLAQNFNEMLGSLTQSYSTLENQKTLLQREIEQRRITEKALLEHMEKLNATNRDLKSFNFVSAHHFQEPLRKIQTFVSLLDQEYQQGALLDETAISYLDYMKDSAAHMRRIIEDFLIFSNLEETIDSKIGRVDLTQLVKTTLGELNFKISELNANIKVEKLPCIEAMAVQMRLVFHQLLDNALKFHHAGSSPLINITSKIVQNLPVEKLDPSEKVFYQIVITDNGIGIEPKYCEKIFDIFQRLHSTQQYPGTGIGLALCRKIVENHGGTIAVFSEKGRGSSFILTLPARLNPMPMTSQQNLNSF